MWCDSHFSSLYDHKWFSLSLICNFTISAIRSRYLTGFTLVYNNMWHSCYNSWILWYYKKVTLIRLRCDFFYSNKYITTAFVVRRSFQQHPVRCFIKAQDFFTYYIFIIFFLFFQFYWKHQILFNSNQLYTVFTSILLV